MLGEAFGALLGEEFAAALGSEFGNPVGEDCLVRWCGARGRAGSGAQTSTNLAKNDGTGHSSLLGNDLGGAEGALLGSLLGPASLREKLGDKLGPNAVLVHG